jgi:hypothetical protein
MTQEPLGVAQKAPIVGRRTLIAALAGGVALAVFPAGSAFADDTSVSVTVGADVFQVATASGVAVQLPRMLGFVLTLERGMLKAGSRAQLTWDPRVYRVSPMPMLTCGGRHLGCHWEGEATTTSGVRTQVVVLDEDLIAGESYVLDAGAGRQLLYPHDIVDEPRALSAQIGSSRTARKHQHKPVRTSRRTSADWGAELSIGWEMVQWGEGFHTWYPALIAVRSTGPASIPHGTKIEVNLDSQLFENLVVGVEGAKQATGRSLGPIVAATYTVERQVPAKTVLTIPVSADRRVPESALSSLEPPLISIGSRSGSPNQRATGGESATRSDSAFDAETRALYGAR